MRYAVIDDKTNTVVNTIILDSPTQWGWSQDHDNLFVVKSDVANIGDTYDGEFFNPNEPVITESNDTTNI